MRRILLLFPLVLATAGFEGDNRSLKTVVEFLGGYTGSYKADCDTMDTPEHPRQLFSTLIGQDGAQDNLLIGFSTGGLKGFHMPEGTISHVQIAEDLLTYLITLPSREILQFRWKKVGKDMIRLEEEENITTHVAYVANGLIAYTGIATPVLTKCIPKRVP